MAFIRRKRVKGRIYFQLVETIKAGGKVKQHVIKHLGNEDSTLEYCRKNKLPFEIREYGIKPNEFFDSSKQVSEFVTALEGRDEIPLKFEYMRDGARRWHDLVHSEDYSLGLMETRLINRSVKEILKETRQTVNLLDLGCGTGEKALLFLEQMKKQKRKYVALDISKAMLELAQHTISKQNPILNSEFHAIDFEAGNFAHITESLREKNYPNSLILFLGNTLGNVSDKSRVLSNIRESMTLQDYLLIGIELFDMNRVQEILNHYDGNKLWKDNVMAALEFFGLTQDDGYFQVKFNKDKSQVEARFVMSRTKKIKCGSKLINLAKGDKILLMISYKATPKNMQILLAETGFIITRLFLNENEDYALFLCKPAKF
ncbi:MAG: L-histidine N(alpha)-methyltransferase [Candidatus Micrarchaeota archaeon]